MQTYMACNLIEECEILLNKKCVKPKSISLISILPPAVEKFILITLRRYRVHNIIIIIYY